mmetsp:Transcript_29557/g.86214  ORF Transcript_29557/g.86214 Transcript_29557/m.86214 type:complete len:257 (+) Transcript_29557:446-1216(+)
MATSCGSPPLPAGSSQSMARATLPCCMPTPRRRTTATPAGLWPTPNGTQPLGENGPRPMCASLLRQRRSPSCGRRGSYTPEEAQPCQSTTLVGSPPFGSGTASPLLCFLSAPVASTQGPPTRAFAPLCPTAATMESTRLKPTTMNRRWARRSDNSTLKGGRACSSPPKSGRRTSGSTPLPPWWKRAWPGSALGWWTCSSSTGLFATLTLSGWTAPNLGSPMGLGRRLGGPSRRHMKRVSYAPSEARTLTNACCQSF